MQPKASKIARNYLAKKAKSSKLREISMLIVLVTYFTIKFSNMPFTATVMYVITSSLFQYDRLIPLSTNHHNDIEDGIFNHRFIQLKETLDSLPVNITYHVVECGEQTLEPIIIYHGILESWRAWKDVMKPFCSSHRVIAVDIEGQGQSVWHSHEQDIKNCNMNIRLFQSKLQLSLLDKLDIDKFNLVVKDYGFWTTLDILDLAPHRVLRYAKFHSIVGVPDNSGSSDINIISSLKSPLQWAYDLNPKAVARVYVGKPKHSLPGLRYNVRVGNRGISDEQFETIILPELQPGMFTSWADSFYYGLDMVRHIQHQLDIFRELACPVYISHGDSDKGLPISHLNGSVGVEIVWKNGQNYIGNYLFFLQKNETHEILNVPTTINTVMKRKRVSKNPLPTPKLPDDYFPNSPWKKVEVLEGVGMFVSLEATKRVINVIQELLSVPLISEG